MHNHTAHHPTSLWLSDTHCCHCRVVQQRTTRSVFPLRATRISSCQGWPQVNRDFRGEATGPQKPAEILRATREAHERGPSYPSPRFCPLCTFLPANDTFRTWRISPSRNQLLVFRFNRFPPKQWNIFSVEKNPKLLKKNKNKNRRNHKQERCSNPNEFLIVIPPRTRSACRPVPLWENLPDLYTKKRRNYSILKSRFSQLLLQQINSWSASKRFIWFLMEDALLNCKT